MVYNRCLVLTVFGPVKARITLWYEGKSIKEKVQLIRIAEENHSSDETGTKHSFREGSTGNSSPCSTALDRFFAPAILNRTSTHEVRCEINVDGEQCSYYNELQVGSEDSYRPQGTLWSGVQPTKLFSQISSEENVSNWIFVLLL